MTQGSGGSLTGDDLTNRVASFLRDRLEPDGWRVEVDSRFGQMANFTVRHDLSTQAGFGILPDSSDERAFAFVERFLAHPEFELMARRPPATPHVSLIQRFRQTAQANQWSVETLAMAAWTLQHEGLLTEAEAEWLAEAGPAWATEGLPPASELEHLADVGAAQVLFERDGVEVVFTGLDLLGMQVIVSFGARPASGASASQRAAYDAACRDHERALEAWHEEPVVPGREHPPRHPLWAVLDAVEVQVADDRGTEYRRRGAGTSGSDSVATSEVRFEPCVSAEASTLDVRLSLESGGLKRIRLHLPVEDR
jgi:hypothetical protein